MARPTPEEAEALVGKKTPRPEASKSAGPNWAPKQPPVEEKKPERVSHSGLSFQTQRALLENGLKKGGVVMATKGKFPFFGKESKKEEKAEKKLSKKAYAAGEKSEGEKGFKRGGKVAMKCGGAVKGKK